MVGDHPDDSAPVSTSASPDGAAPGGVGGDGALELGYTVTVDNFSGPLDLLLYLVRRTELDILEVPLALIVDQFVDTVRSWQDADLDVAGEFILMAATLLELKARTIAPPLEQPVEGAEDEPMFDPRESLLKSLLAYRRFKEASQVITELGDSRWPLVDRQFREHVPEAPPEDSDIDLGEIDVALLSTTCERILSRIGGLGPRTVVVDEMPLGLRIATLLDELSARERASITELLVGNTSRVAHITTVMATLELARQRFIEVQQPEQFGDIRLRLRSIEERERLPELPPVEPEGPKRRRKLPLVTWHAPVEVAAGADEPVADAAVDDAPEEVVESDEQRFLRELEETTRVTAVLALTADVEKSFTEHWYTLHPELKPAPVPVVQPEVVPVPTVKRAPPKRRAPAEATPAGETPAPTAVVAAAQPATVSEAVSPAVEAPAPVAAEHPTAAATLATETAEAPVIASEPPTTEVVVAAATEAPAVEAEQPAVASEAAVAAVAVETPALVESAPQPVAGDFTEPTPQPVAVETPEACPQSVLPVEQWPVLHALPELEETPHPLDTIASDDPAAVNAALGEPSSRSLRVVESDEEKDDENTDELLADDPALVNAALQAETPRPVVERRQVADVIPAASATTEWSAPNECGQTKVKVDDQLLGSAEPEAETPKPGTPREELDVEEQPPTVRSQTPAVSEASPTFDEATPPSVESLRLDDDVAPSSVVNDNARLPDDQDAYESAAVVDPALVEAAQHADAPRSVDLHPVHDLTIPAASETTVWTAPVDRGQTAATVDEDDSVETVLVRPSIVEAAEDLVVKPPAVVAPTSVVDAAPFTIPLCDPTPTTAPLELSAPASEPIPAPAALSVDEGGAGRIEPTSAVAVVAEPEPPLPAKGEPVSDPAPPDGPPVEPPPPLPPAPPLPTPRKDSPNPAPTTSPTKTTPMPPPPRSKLWLLIAIFIAINNATWVGAWWLTSLPRAVLEVAATERGGTPEQETLTWRFNLDVVDAVAQAKPPEVVPVISPAVPGRWHWTDARTLMFDAAGKLPLATTFTATLPTNNFRTVHGFRLRAAGTQTWSTAALSASDATVETFTREGTVVTLTFNQPVDPLAIAQKLSAEVTPIPEPAFVTVTEKAPVVAASPVALSDQQPTVAEAAPVLASDAHASSQPSATSDQQPALAASAPEVVPTDAASTPSVTTPSLVAASPVVQVRAITSDASSTIRLLIATPVRGTATLRLLAGTRGVAGPLGLAEGWERQVTLRQTLVLDSAITEVPSHGDIRIDVAVSDPQAPRELLAPVVTVEPSVPVTVSTTDAGLSLTGAFMPGETYRIRAASTWPDEPATSGHVLAAYTSASEVVVTIPARPTGIWPVDGTVIDGHTRLAAHAVERADVLLVTAEDECVVSREVVWSSQPTATVDLDDLTETQPAGSYRLRVRSQGETPTTSDQTLHIDDVRLRPQALIAALSDWLLAALAGQPKADVRVRVVRLTDS